MHVLARVPISAPPVIVLLLLMLASLPVRLPRILALTLMVAIVRVVEIVWVKTALLQCVHQTVQAIPHI
jgi:hypothetical protein